MKFPLFVRLGLLSSVLALGAGVTFAADDLGAVRGRMEKRLSSVNALKDRKAVGETNRGLLEGRAGVVSGILNGIDTEVWNPTTDALIAARYDASTPSERRPNKSALQRRLGLKVDRKAMVFGVVSRQIGRAHV